MSMADETLVVENGQLIIIEEQRTSKTEEELVGEKAELEGQLVIVNNYLQEIRK